MIIEIIVYNFSACTSINALSPHETLAENAG